ncbi:MAG TPA: glycosyltransferase family 4 protein [Chloroflexota bacterium]|nr:glycosyltransferase family 4 protein [Chloroflexota bacterium]
MKILHVIQRYWPYTGGSERHLQEISERLVRRGHRVTVFTTDAFNLELFWNRRKERVDTPVEAHNGVDIRRFPVRHLPGDHLAFGGIRRGMSVLSGAPFATGPLLRAMAAYAPRVPDLRRALDNLDDDYDVVHGMNVCFETLLLPALAAARRHRIPFIVTPLIHLGESERSVVRRFYTMPHQLQLIAQADAVLAQTPIEVDYLIAHKVARDRITLSGVGVNPSEVLGGVADRFRLATGLTTPLVVYIGTSAYDKGTVHLVEAMCRLWDRAGQPCAADLVLAGPVFDQFQTFLDRLPARHRAHVHVLGFVDEAAKRDLLDAASVVAMPSRTDSFGIVYLEGWLYRKPVIGARAGGVPAVIDDRGDGFLVDFGDVAALAGRIAQLLAEPGLAAAMGERGRTKVMERFTWDQIYPVVEEVYERLCRRAMVR